ncbi:MAG TPA: RagB/SusD family nutrient uptake outer membrane protein [Prolixibacteraceae bacterium]|nr:RagB/SusD family nutrient uptake outer membrane protein [Prolixibacteraceae bacterium]
MIRNKFLITTLGLAALLLSCEEYLDVESPSAFDAQYVFSNSSDAQKVIWGIYARFGEDAFTSRQSCVWLQNTDVECMGVSASPDGSRRDIWSLQGGLLSTFIDVQRGWDNDYLAIDRANQCIEGILSSEISDDVEMQQLLGEAYCLRSFFYYLLVGYWGDVPYFRQAAKGGMELDIPKCDKNIIYSMCIQDLVDIQEKMYWSGEMEYGTERMNREFCIGMAARLALFRAGYGMTKDGTMKRAEEYMDMNNDSLKVTYTLNGVTKTAVSSADYFLLAKEYCQLLIDSGTHELETDFHQIFTNQCKYVKTFGGDVLFEVGFLAAKGGDVGWCVGSPVTSSPFGTTTIQVNFNAAYLYMFDEHDSRMDATIARVSTSNAGQELLGPTAMACAKWNRLWMSNSMGSESSKGTGINWPLMRYSDIYLMLAEAENELNGPTNIAKNALATVRKRAFGPYASDVDSYIAEKATGKDAFFNMVIDERALEFGGECLRKFDLVRWNKYGKKIIETKDKLTNMGLTANNAEGKIIDEYANYAPDVYYAVDVNKGITILNPLFKIDEANLDNILAEVMGSNIENVTEVVKTSWLKKLVRSATAGEEATYTESDYVIRSWRGYTDPTGEAAVPYLIAIPESKIVNSKYLNNDGYGLIAQ